MQFKEKIDSLKETIFDQLIPLIDDNFVYLDLPYHDNIGDTLIWEGTLHFINKLKFKCLYKASIVTFKSSKIKSSKKSIILLHGGGNFGDLWYEHQRFRLDIIQKYPEHKIIILPQTVFYKDEKQLRTDAEIMAHHPDLTICARDHKSFDLLKTHFSANKALLLPDMAFCIPPRSLNKYLVKESDKTLLLKRNDKELSEASLKNMVNIDQKYDVHDWPSLEKIYPSSKRLYDMIASKHVSRGMTDWYANQFFKKNLIAVGTRFISSYKEIYTTRLHVAILSILLHKKCYFLDNSYGKNSTFFETWLYNLEGITFLPNNNEGIHHNSGL